MTDAVDASGPSYAVSGWIEAALYVFAIGVLGLVYVVAGRLGAHPIAFVLDSMLLSALVMLAVTGAGRTGGGSSGRRRAGPSEPARS